jgi:hypothetical protein
VAERSAAACARAISGGPPTRHAGPIRPSVARKETPSAESGFGKSERGLAPDGASWPSCQCQAKQSKGRSLAALPALIRLPAVAPAAHIVWSTAGCLGLVRASIVLARASARRVGFARPAVLDC